MIFLALGSFCLHFPYAAPLNEKVYKDCPGRVQRTSPEKQSHILELLDLNTRRSDIVNSPQLSLLSLNLVFFSFCRIVRKSSSSSSGSPSLSSSSESEP